ncbi:MAG: TOPRIM nucleotidyl transferase/hydrolase domain-containing protein [Metamycoplasmataceae bacterium]
MSLNIYIGKNKTGKTDKLKTILKENKEKTIFFEAEIDPNSLIEERPSDYDIETPQSTLIKFINKLFEIKYSKRKQWKEETKIKYEDLYNKSKEITEQIKKLPKTNNFIDKDIVNSLQLREKETSYFWHILPIKSFLRWDRYAVRHKTRYEKGESSAGSKLYSIIEIVFNILKNLFINGDDHLKKEMKNWKIIIDEPEKFSHPELISQIGGSIYELSKLIDITIATHSPFLIEAIQKKIEFDENKVIGFKIKYHYFYNKKTKFKEKELKNFSNILKKQNYRRKKIIINALFSSNLILYEGINDETFLYSLINKISNNKYISFCDCDGKKGVLKTFEILEDLGLSNILNIALFYDNDNDGKLPIKNNKIIHIIQDKNLEECFFGLEDPNKKSCFKVKKRKYSIHKEHLDVKWNYILKNSTVKNIKDVIDKKEKELKKWLDIK